MLTLKIVAAVLLSSPVISPATDPVIPAHLANAFSPDHLRFGYQAGSVTTFAYPPAVKIDWRASALTNSAPNYSLVPTNSNGELLIGNHSSTKLTQRFRVGITPTSAAVINKSSILIGGVDHVGNTVVERWTLSYPIVQPPLQADLVTGVTSVAIAQPTRSSVARIFSENVAGRKLVRNLCTIRKDGQSSTEALVQFEDSGDIYTMNLQTGAISLLASSTAGTFGAVPSLATTNHRLLSFGDRSNYGYVYSLIANVLDDSPTINTPSVLFFDQDRNGTIDSVIELPDAAYRSQGWFDTNNYQAPWTY